MVAGQAILLYGWGGTVSRSTDGGASFAAIASGTDQPLGGSLVAGQAILLYGWGGTVVRLSDALSEQAGALTLPAGAEGDAVLQGFFDGLPAHIADLTEVAALRRDFADIRAQRQFLIKDRIQPQADLDRLGNLPYSLLLLDRQREDFAAFMQICRGTPEPVAPPAGTEATVDADQMTLACLDGWKVQSDSETQSWWQTIATQLPPGILLLFLLSTLAALYRYNLRLSAFHHSRAGALELLAAGKTKDDIEQLTAIAAVLAADKVVFGRDHSATRQAADLIRSLIPTK